MFEHFNVTLKDNNITNSNYAFITFLNIEPISNYKAQIVYLETVLKSLSFPFVSAIEYSDKSSKGYHAHIICKLKDVKSIILNEKIR